MRTGPDGGDHSRPNRWSRIPPGATGKALNLFQRRLVEVGKCIIGAPRVVLLDEPPAGLSQQEGAVLRDVVVRIPANAAHSCW